jgi:hypothetical protein
MSDTFTIYEGETLGDLVGKCKNLAKIPQVLLDRQIAPIDTGVFEFSLSEKEGCERASIEHLLAFLGHFPQALWTMADHNTRLIQGRGVTLHVSNYPKVANSKSDVDNRPDDGKAYISATELYSFWSKSHFLNVRKIAETPTLTEVSKESRLRITSFEGSLAHFLHREDFALQVADMAGLLHCEVIVPSTKTRAGLLPISNVYSELGVCVSRDEVLEQMRVNRKQPGTLPQLLTHIRDVPSVLASGPVITLGDDGFEVRLLPSRGIEPDTLVIERYLPCPLGDHYQARYFYLSE